jgi:hypothetical protein
MKNIGNTIVSTTLKAISLASIAIKSGKLFRKDGAMLSEVAQLRKQLELEAESLMLLSTGFKTTGSHEIINSAYDRLGEHQARLIELVGEQKAAEIVVNVLRELEQ